MKSASIPVCLVLVTLGLTACGGAMASPQSPSSSAYGGYGVTGTASTDDYRVAEVRTESDSESAPASRAPSSLQSGVAQAPQAAPAPPPTTPTTPTTPPTPTKSAPGTTSERTPVLIYTAELWLAVSSIEPSLAASEGIAREVGGFMTNRDNTSISLRVPAERFDEALDKLVKLGDVINRRVTAQDVTEEYRDLTLRIKNAEAIRDRLTELLAKATNVEESIAVESELGRVTAEIETMKGRLTYLRDRAALSTITLRFQKRSEEVSSAASFRLPIPWLGQLGLGRLLNLEGR